MEKVFIVDGLRTPIGGMGQSLKTLSAVSLGGSVIRKIVEKNSINKSSLDEVIMGNVISTGLGQNPARQALVAAGLSVETPAFTINKVCGSGLKSAVLASQAILCRDSDLIIAGGLESASQCPYILPRNKKSGEFKKEDLGDSLIDDGLWCKLNNTHMGVIAEYTAKEFNISREDQDIYTLDSHRKAIHAQEQGLSANEIVPISINDDKIFSLDEKPRKNLSLEKLSNLPAAFEANGTVTAGSSSAPADGAAALIFSSDKGLKENKLTPLAYILGYATVAVEAKLVFTAPALAIKKCLKLSSLELSDVDIFEINEAFSVQALVTMNLSGADKQRLNVFGGTLALGHPLGVSGARGLVTLINVLKVQNKKIGLTATCLGGGSALALAIRMV
ncbi:MAG: thiolase family protein [Candidatus Omnitrophica bacterium]|nr:thiolase family protein [Candidatus Omnitrophota bacterium]